MFKLIGPALVAGFIGSAAMIGAPSSASAQDGSAQARFAGLMESGAAIDYARGRGGGMRGGGRGGRGGFAGGGRGFRGDGFAGRGRGYGGGYGYRRGGIGGGAASGLGLGGLAAGALLGGALAAQAEPAPYYGVQQYEVAPDGDAEAYCVQRFRSYDPRSGTYLGNDGLRHACP